MATTVIELPGVTVVELPGVVLLTGVVEPGLAVVLLPGLSVVQGHVVDTGLLGAGGIGAVAGALIVQRLKPIPREQAIMSHPRGRMFRRAIRCIQAIINRNVDYHSYNGAVDTVFCDTLDAATRRTSTMNILLHYFMGLIRDLVCSISGTYT